MQLLASTVFWIIVDEVVVGKKNKLLYKVHVIQGCHEDCALDQQALAVSCLGRIVFCARLFSPLTSETG